jgi:hypothetical protein
MAQSVQRKAPQWRWLTAHLRFCQFEHSHSKHQSARGDSGGLTLKQLSHQRQALAASGLTRSPAHLITPGLVVAQLGVIRFCRM